MAREIVLSTKDADYDGYLDLVFKSEDGAETKRVTRIDVVGTLKKIEDFVPENTLGTEFMQRVRQFIQMEYGITVNVEMAWMFYNSLSTYVDEIRSSFFSLGLSSPDSTDSTPETTLPLKSESSTSVEKPSEPKSLENLPASNMEASKKSSPASRHSSKGKKRRQK